MLEEISERVLSYIKLSFLWIIVLICTLVFFWEGQSALFILWGFWLFLVGMLGIALSIKGLALIIREKNRLLSAIVFMTVLGGVILLASGKVFFWGIWPRFYLAKIYYDYKVKNVLAAKTLEDAKSICDGSCRVNLDDNGNLKQIIFPLGKVGAFFGWQAFVYDPAGGVIQSARAWQGDRSIPPQFRGRIYLGCSLLGAHHLSGNWYFCSFWHD